MFLRRIRGLRVHRRQTPGRNKGFNSKHGPPKIISSDSDNQIEPEILLETQKRIGHKESIEETNMGSAVGRKNNCLSNRVRPLALV